MIYNASDRAKELETRMEPYRGSNSAQSLQNSKYWVNESSNEPGETPNTKMSYSTFESVEDPNNMRPKKKIRTFESPMRLQAHRQTVEPNVSYTRSYSSSALSDFNQTSSGQWTNHKTPQSLNESDEDERFLRLAREALVATASSAQSSHNMMVDPTILDLLTRLQYVSSPHGNPIRRSDQIRANDNGQLMIQNFYEDFPNLSNNIFTEDKDSSMNDIKKGSGPPRAASQPQNHHEDWNFLIGEPLHLESKPPQPNTDVQTQPLPIPSTDPTAGLSDSSAKSGRDDDDDRKFPCSKCSMSFRRSSDLKRHEKQHLSIPPNICSLCGKGFARKDALKRHSGTLTCKRNADRNLYTENLQYLNESNPGKSQSNLSPFDYNSTSDW